MTYSVTFTDSKSFLLGKPKQLKKCLPLLDAGCNSSFEVETYTFRSSYLRQVTLFCCIKPSRGLHPTETEILSHWATKGYTAPPASLPPLVHTLRPHRPSFESWTRLRATALPCLQPGTLSPWWLHTWPLLFLQTSDASSWGTPSRVPLWSPHQIAQL